MVCDEDHALGSDLHISPSLSNRCYYLLQSCFRSPLRIWAAAGAGLALDVFYHHGRTIGGEAPNLIAEMPAVAEKQCHACSQATEPYGICTTDG